MGALALNAQRHPALQRIEELEARLGGVVDKLVGQAEDDGMSSRDRSRCVLTTLHYLNYARQLAEKAADTPEELGDDDLIAMPQQDIEKIMRFCIKQLGPQRVKELAG